MNIRFTNFNKPLSFRRLKRFIYLTDLVSPCFLSVKIILKYKKRYFKGFSYIRAGTGAAAP